MGLFVGETMKQISILIVVETGKIPIIYAGNKQKIQDF